MSTQTKRNGQAAATDVDPSALLEQILNSRPTQRYRVIDDALQTRIAKVEELLPPGMRGQGARLVKRAMLTFSGKPELEKCSPASFIKCVLQAAELGLAIDSRLAHAVPYNGEAVLQVDYKGMIAVAKRTKLIADIYARNVSEMDEFEAWEEDEKCHLHYRRNLLASGRLIAAYAKVILPNGGWRFEIMTTEEIDEVRKTSKSFQFGKGPWIEWDGEMRKKTVIKRTLKNYQDDPAIVRMLEIDDEDHVETPHLDRIIQRSKASVILDRMDGEKPEPQPIPTLGGMMKVAEALATHEGDDDPPEELWADAEMECRRTGTFNDDLDDLCKKAGAPRYAKCTRQQLEAVIAEMKAMPTAKEKPDAD